MGREPVRFYDRKSGSLQEEIILGDSLLRLAYTRPGQLLFGWALFKTALFSRLLGWYADRPSSAKRVEKTIQQLQIEMGDYQIPAEGFRTFNDFFTRKLKPGARNFSGRGILSPADCRMTVYPRLENGTVIPVKGFPYTVHELLGKEGGEFSSCFQHGMLCVARLCPADYHRFHFPADGKVLKSWFISGNYHSVSPVALEKGLRVFPRNVRQVTMLDLGQFGRCAYIEVGAFGVASITQTATLLPGTEFHKGDEKGYFSFGGSTVILVFEPGCFSFAADLLEQSQKGIETRLLTGDLLSE